MHTVSPHVDVIHIDRPHIGTLRVLLHLCRRASRAARGAAPKRCNKQMCFLERMRCARQRGSAQRRRRPWRRRRNFFALEDQKRVFLTKNESTSTGSELDKTQKAKRAKSCGSNRVVVVSAVKSSCELGDRLLQADTAYCKQLTTGNAKVPIL